jgi:hypothetical protein
MMLNHWRWDVRRLCGVPVFDRAVKPWLQRGAKLKILRPSLQVMPPIFIAKADQEGFFGKTTFSALTMSCTQAFSLIGSSAIISEPAAITMAMAARVVGSIVNTVAVVLPI